MARYPSSYDGERRTVKRSTKFTPSEAAALDERAARQCMRWSDFSRQAMLSPIGMATTAAKKHWDPRVAHAFTHAGHAYSSIGNVLNPIARHLHTTDELGSYTADLREALARYKDVAKTHKDAIERLGSVLSPIGMATTVAKKHSDPHVAHAFTHAGHAHSSIGNLLNQIARHLHTAEELGPYAADLRKALALYNDVAGMHKAALAQFRLQ
jgi:phosphoglycerate-specific signal transduction histidine kinase